jgi:hypothetical protein
MIVIGLVKALISSIDLQHIKERGHYIGALHNRTVALKEREIPRLRRETAREGLH